MEISEQIGFRSVLQEMRREILNRQKRAGTVISENVFVTDRVLDEADKAEANSRLAVNVELCEHASSTLRSIRLALGRIDRGVFGDCLDCRGEIPSLRLQAMPYTPLCRQCQEEAESSPYEELTREERVGRRKINKAKAPP